jgi:hypothetical protein
MRSVHTLASVQAHFGPTSLPCLARGTPGRFNCCAVSFTLPPSCPPWLHGRYPLRRYYGDSDSCPAPSSTRTGLLDYRTCISGHSVSNHPMRPRLPAILLAPVGLGLRFAFCRYRRFFGFRSLQAVSSVASGRIEFVSRASNARLFYGLSFRFQLLSTPRDQCLASRQTHPALPALSRKKSVAFPIIIWDVHSCERRCSFTTWEGRLPAASARNATKRSTNPSHGTSALTLT